MDDDRQSPPEESVPVVTPPAEEVVLQERVTVTAGEMRSIDRRASWAAHNWSWLLAVGIIAVIFGIVVLANAFGSLAALIWLTGLFLVFIGIVQIVTPAHGGSRGVRIAGGVVALIGGIVCLAWPGATLTVLAVIAGLTFLLWGVVRTYAAFSHPGPDRGWDIAVGIGLLFLGILMMAWPGATIAVIGLILGLIALIWGLVTIGNALHLRAVARHWERVKARAHRA
jgi:uncharacterized membrane protein HdeD (DUF308 family)